MVEETLEDIRERIEVEDNLPAWRIGRLELGAFLLILTIPFGLQLWSWFHQPTKEEIFNIMVDTLGERKPSDVFKKLDTIQEQEQKRDSKQTLLLEEIIKRLPPPSPGNIQTGDMNLQIDVPQTAVESRKVLHSAARTRGGYTTSEYAILTNQSVREIQDKCKTGEIEAVKSTNGHYLINLSSIKHDLF